MADKQDRPNSIYWPPILDFCALAAAVSLHLIVPLPHFASDPWSTVVGAVLVTFGGALGLAGIINFRSVGTSFDPTAPARSLATDGVYRLTRNPMYLGTLIGFIGLGLLLSVAWLIIVALPLAISIQKLAIVREEAYLLRRFGTAYVDYCKRVRRWI